MLPKPPHSPTYRPPGLSARNTPAATAAWSGIQCSAALVNTESNSAVKSRRCPSSLRTSRPRARAAASMSSSISVPSTDAPAATSFSVSTPSPQPRSRMRSPGCGLSNASTGAPSAGTNAACCA